MKVGGLALWILIASACWALAGCGDDDASGGDGGTDTDTDTDSDSDSDSDSDADGDAGPDGGSPYDAHILWAKRSGGGHTDVSYGLGVLDDSSPVVTGMFLYDTVFGDGEVSETELVSDSTGASDMYVAGFGGDGAFRWVRHDATGWGTGAAALPDERFALIGSYSGNFVLGEGEPNETEFSAGVGLNIFVAVYESDGSLAWAKSARGNTSVLPEEVAAGPDGSIYLVGEFSNEPGPSITFDVDGANETTLDSQGDYDGFLAKYSAGGAFLWALSFGGTEAEWIGRPAVSGDGVVWVAGSFAGTAIFAAGEPEETSLSSAGGRDVYVARYDSEGSLIGAAGFGGAADDRSSGVGVAADGTAVVAGSFGGTVVFGPGEANETALTANGTDDIFLAKYGTDGSLTWVSAFVGAGDDGAMAVATWPDGSSAIVGYFDDAIAVDGTASAGVELTSDSGLGTIVAKFDATGALRWATELEIPFPDSYGYGIVNAAAAPDGSTYLSGAFAGTMVAGVEDPGETTLTSIPGDTPEAAPSDLYLVKIAP